MIALRTRANDENANAMREDLAQDHVGSELELAIVDARRQIAAQKATVDELIRQGHKTNASVALLATFEDALQQMLAHRGHDRRKF